MADLRASAETSLFGITFSLLGVWAWLFRGSPVGCGPLVLLHEGAVYIDQDALLPLRDRRIGEHSHLHRGGRMLSRIKDSGADIKRFCGDPKRFRQLLQHFCRRFAQATLDLTQIGIGNAGLLGELTQRQLRRLTLPRNELTEGAKLVRDLV